MEGLLTKDFQKQINQFYLVVKDNFEEIIVEDIQRKNNIFHVAIVRQCAIIILINVKDY